MDTRRDPRLAHWLDVVADILHRPLTLWPIEYSPLDCWTRSRRVTWTGTGVTHADTSALSLVDNENLMPKCCVTWPTTSWNLTH
jgi:hypothetical protein